MKSPRRVLLLLSALLFASGLAGPARAQVVIYVHDAGDPNGAVHALLLDEDAGTLAPLEGSPFTGPAVTSGCTGHCMTMDPGQRGKQRYLFTAQDEGVMAWTLDEAGVLTLVEGSPFDGGLGTGDFTGVGTVERGKELFVYVAAFALDQVAGFRVTDDHTLEPTPGSPYQAGDGPEALDALGKVVVTVNEGEASVSSFVSQKDGSLLVAPGSPVDTDAGFAYTLQLDPRGRTVWVADANDSDLFGFKVKGKTGELTPLSDLPEDGALPLLDGGTEPTRRLLVTFQRTGDAGLADMAVHDAGSKKGLQLLGRGISGFDTIASHALDERLGLLVVVDDSVLAGPSVRVFRMDTRRGGLLLLAEAEVPFVDVNDVQILEL